MFEFDRIIGDLAESSSLNTSQAGHCDRGIQVRDRLCGRISRNRVGFFRKVIPAILVERQMISF
jgi:hypothetical protein